MASRPPSTSRIQAPRAKSTARYVGSAASRGYDAAWSRASKAFLADHPLCRYCETGAFTGDHRVTAAILVDHFHPHRGDQALFWDRHWWVASCKPCHDGPKQKAEHRGAHALDVLARAIGLRQPSDTAYSAATTRSIR